MRFFEVLIDVLSISHTSFCDIQEKSMGPPKEKA